MESKNIRENVSEVIDGDTFYTDNRKRKHPIRLANVDAPEKGDPGFAQATKELEKLISEKEVMIEQVARDKYGRPVAKVKIGNKSVNKAMQEYLKKLKK
ncbi:MAG: thermonuclease family protein [Candidatus Poribacteria bacterium]